MRSIVLLIFSVVVLAQQSAHAQTGSAMTRLRPIGSPSAVDQFRSPATRQPAVSPVAASTDRQPPAVRNEPVVRNETAYWQTSATVQPASAPIRQTVWMQSGFDAPPLDGVGMPFPNTPPNSALPPSTSTPLPNSTPFPDAATLPRSLPSPPSTPIPSSSDLTPIPQPQLDTNSYARIENCNLVTPPSTYMAASAFGCGCGQVVPTAYTTPACGPVTQSPYAAAPGTLPAEIPSTATIPPVSVYPQAAPQPLGFPNSAAPARALITLGQENYAVQVGQGLLGQPVAYVPGQWLRNWLRYLSP
ncbi:MAG: hypothetical protein KDB00_07895 [Planctomycetales bacterium]|nr:hypothetical protein [Planctomycetales bacterium]